LYVPEVGQTVWQPFGPQTVVQPVCEVRDTLHAPFGQAPAPGPEYVELTTPGPRCWEHCPVAHEPAARLLVFAGRAVGHSGPNGNCACAGLAAQQTRTVARTVLVKVVYMTRLS
jgi:hypothetical protein